MSNVNDYKFAKVLGDFKARVLDPQIKRTEEAKKIMEDPDYKWESQQQNQLARAKLDSYKEWVSFYKAVYEEGLALCTQHENLVNKMSKFYDKWYNDISNEGKQEVEMMSMQADMLQEIFVEIYQELKPLKLDIKQPSALNLK